MSDQQQPPAEPFGRGSREQRRTAETVALNKDELAQLRAQAQQPAPQQPAPQPPPAPAPPMAAPSGRPVNHTVLALGLAAAVVVVILVLALVSM